MIPTNIRKVSIVTFLTHFHFYIHVYALLLLNRGLTLIQVSAIESAVIFFVFFMEVPTGVLADRLGRKWSVTASLFCLMLAEFLFLFVRAYPLYFIIAFLTGTGFAFASGATESLIYDSLPGENREDTMKKVMGQIGSVKQLAAFLSPLLGGLIVSDLTQPQFNLAISLTVLSLLIGVVVSLTLNEPQTGWDLERQSSLRILQNGVRELSGNRKLQRLVLLVVLTTPFTGMLVTTLVPPYLRQWQVSPLMIGLAMSLGNLLAALAQKLAYPIEKKLGKRWGVAALTVLPGFSYLVLAAARVPLFSWLLVTWMYGTNDMRSPLISAYQNEMIKSSSRSTVLSLVNMLMNLFVALMMPVYAALATNSAPLAFVTMGSIILLTSLSLRADRLVVQKQSA